MTDYISREAALDRIIEYDFQHCPDYMEDWATELKHAVICDLKDAVETLHAADVAPVVHAEWVMTEFVSEDTGIWWSWYCSNCGDTYDGLGKLVERKHKYCHHCGAKMDGGEKDATVE